MKPKNDKREDISKLKYEVAQEVGINQQNQKKKNRKKTKN
ncbi:MAG: small, acid-soluble spore protein, alpha/beta type [Syntrophomonadaceae bacterium]|nr:small, acid-soluble spore protein, alpha/beta type [Syntrophomonadaceae bacterium]